MPYNESNKAAALKYKAVKIKRVPLDMQLSDYETLKAAAERAGEPVNTYIKRAIRQRMDCGEPEPPGVYTL